MNDATTTAGARGVQGFSRPLLWSAAGHVLALGACLVLGGRGSGARLLPAVEVLLVADQGGAGGRPLSPRASGAASAGVEERPAAAAPASSPPPAAAREPAGAVPALPPAETIVPGPAAAISPGPAAPGPTARIGTVVAGPAPEGMQPGAGPVSTLSGGADVASIAGAGPAPGALERDGGGGRSGERGLLRERIQSRIVYPAEAVRRRLEGEVLLRIRIETGGNPGEIRVARSSGARLLDDAARRGVVRAAPLPGSPGWVEVPVLFRLR